MKIGIAEILQEVRECGNNNLKKAKLIEYDSPSLRTILGIAYDDNWVWDLPEGDPPYSPLDKSTDQQGMLYTELRRIYLFRVGGNPNLKPLRREQLFVDLLEHLDPDDAELLIQCKNSRIPGVTKKLVSETFEGLLPDETKESTVAQQATQ